MNCCKPFWRFYYADTKDIDALQCFQFCHKFHACALRGRLDQNKYSRISSARFITGKCT